MFIRIFMYNYEVEVSIDSITNNYNMSFKIV